MIDKTENELITWIAEYCYRKANPNSKMDTPNIVYEQIEKDFLKFLGYTSSKELNHEQKQCCAETLKRFKNQINACRKAEQQNPYNRYYVTNSNNLHQLEQLLRIVWDGDLISKSERDELVKEGLAMRVEGYNIITEEGIRVLKKLKVIHP